MTATQSCRTCGAPLLADGLCPRCVLAEAQVTPAPRPRKMPTQQELAAQFPAYEIGELLGQGGMGLVFRARQRTLQRTIALKLLAAEIAEDPGFAERFAR